jgi:hypothetical protein
MNNPRLEPHDADEVDKKGDAHRAKQPYASELDDRELEHAQKEQRPVSPSGKADRPESASRS